MEEISEKFNFNIPLEILGKGDEEGEWRIGGIASTENKDFQGETVQIDGLDISTLAKNGFFNQDHKKGFENILGKIEKAEKRKDDENGKHLYVEGRLFKTQPAAKAAWNIMNELDKGGDPTGKRMQLSVEGKITKRIGKDKKVIAKAKVENIALTLNPINEGTFANFLKSFEAAQNSDPEEVIKENEFVEVRLHKSVVEKLEEYVDNKKSFKEHIYDLAKRMDQQEQKSFLRVLKKALTVTHSYATELPGERTGGDVMTQESLDKKKKKKEKLKKIVYEMKKSFPKLDLAKLVKTVFERYTLKGEL